MIEIKHFRLLAAVAEHGTLSGAAGALGCSQPALTQQMQALERSVRTPLVVRTGSGTRLTEAGEVLLRHGRDILDHLALAEAEVSALTGLRVGRVRVVAFPSAAAAILPDAVTDMTQRFPGVLITLAEAEPPQALQMLRRGECDLAVIFRYPTEPELSGSDLLQVPLLTERVHLALSAGHELAREAPVNLSQLADSRWIAGCPRCRTHLLELCADAGFVPNIVFETDDYLAIQALAARGLGAALITDLMLAVVRVPELRLQPFIPDSTRVTSAVSTHSLSRVPAVREMISALQRCAEQMSN